LSAAVGSFSCAPVSAGGEVFIRYPDKMVGASCKGRLVEWWAISGNGFGYSGSYVLACVLGPSKTEWVLIAGVSCYDSQGADKKCLNERLKIFDSLSLGPNERYTSDGMYASTIKLLRLGFGKHCTIQKQKYTVLPDKEIKEEKPFSAIYSAWSCANIRIADRLSLVGDDANPKNVHLEEITMIGRTLFKTGKMQTNLQPLSLHSRKICTPILWTRRSVLTSLGTEAGQRCRVRLSTLKVQRACRM
jgi:hypothetical protein